MGIMLNEQNPRQSRCIRCNTCDGFPCLVQAKADAQVVCVEPALTHPNVEILTNACVERLETSPSGRAISTVRAIYKGELIAFSADIVVSSCGAINSAALLLRSANDKHPRGLANSSDLVGRHYMSHINTMFLALSWHKNETKFNKTLGLNDFYFPTKEWEYPMGHISLMGNADANVLRAGAPRIAPGWSLELMAEHAVPFWVVSEDLPDSNNRVTLRRLIRRPSCYFYLCLCLAVAVRSTTACTQESATPLATAVDAIGMTVSDMDRSLEFYSHVLSFEKVSDVEVWGAEYEQLQGVFGLRMRVVRLRLGGEFIELTEYLTPKGKLFPADSHSNDRWFQHIAIIVSDMDKAYDWLRKNKVQHASTGSHRLPDWNPNAGGISAFYLRDPDGHFLEILQFPPGKGDPKWRQGNERLFLGIDHTALVVHDTEESLKFYRDTLGLGVTGQSENSGVEQEHLNNVFGARLRIASLRAAAGPGIELLDYLTPRDGRPLPTDEKANDLMHWHTRLVTLTAHAAAQRLRLGAYAFVSSGPVSLQQPQLGCKKAFLVRDPDGHVMLFSEQ
jgi:catechol 2,3-dioxygenase-like lactoylglutathione lyase family enzyme